MKIRAVFLYLGVQPFYIPISEKSINLLGLKLIIGVR